MIDLLSSLKIPHNLDSIYSCYLLVVCSVGLDSHFLTRMEVEKIANLKVRRKVS